MRQENRGFSKAFQPDSLLDLTGSRTEENREALSDYRERLLKRRPFRALPSVVDTKATILRVRIKVRTKAHERDPSARSRARNRWAAARSRRSEPEGRGRQDHHRHQSRNRPRRDRRARSHYRSRSPGQRVDRAWHRSQSRVTSSYDTLVGERALRDVIIPTAMPRLFIAPSTMDLLGVELEISGHDDRSYKLRNALRTYGKSSGDDPEPVTYVLVDCPPSLNLLTINALAAADAVVVPLQCEFFALEGLSQLLTTESLRAIRLASLARDFQRDLAICLLAVCGAEPRCRSRHAMSKRGKRHAPHQVQDRGTHQ